MCCSYTGFPYWLLPSNFLDMKILAFKATEICTTGQFYPKLLALSWLSNNPWVLFIEVSWNGEKAVAFQWYMLFISSSSLGRSDLISILNYLWSSSWTIFCHSSNHFRLSYGRCVNNYRIKVKSVPINFSVHDPLPKGFSGANKYIGSLLITNYFKDTFYQLHGVLNNLFTTARLTLNVNC